MKTQKLFLLLVVAGSLMLAACNLNADAVATSVAATLQISQLETLAAREAQASPTLEASATPTITETPTPSAATLTVSQATNCRRGPRIDYSFVTLIAAGQEVEVLMTFPGANYVVIRNPNGAGDCWLWLQYADSTDFSDHDLPVATQPPTPTPTLTPTATPTPVYTWTDTWNLWNPGGPVVLTAVQSGNSVTGSYPGCTISGTLSADWRTLTGTWNCGGTGTFLFYMQENLNQAVGNWNDLNDFCLARNGAPMPAPCLYP